MDHELERRFLVVTGEASGDLHAAHLVEALRALGPCRVRGVAGPAMRDAGVECVVRSESLAVLGFAEILQRLPLLFDTRRRLLAEYDRFRPHAVVLVDYPGFNLRLGPMLKRRGARTFYYIAPQVWAWHPERARTMARWVDHLAVVFPFEEPLFRAAGVPVTFVGHPLLDDFGPETDAPSFHAALGIDPSRPLLGLLPGSRTQETARHAGIMIEGARRLAATRPGLQAVMALAPGMEVPDGLDLGPVRLARGLTRATQAFSTACAVASGTATLETALFGTPLVVVYRTGALNYAIARRLVQIQRIGLPNIVAESMVAPELIQGDLTPDALVRELAPWLDDPLAREAQHRALGVVRERLGAPGASARAAARLWELAA
ncbi:MAG TPA: lipid-A-disaccharide synthase [Candidatus Eisenbacteria bacterium]|nr:lipid-A-disaccharide synthase [Candidatus Eisenbacteria bacterium]